MQNGQHRQRRRAVFSTANVTPAESSDDEEEGDEEAVGEDLEARQQSGSSAESSGQDDSDAESNESEGELQLSVRVLGLRQNISWIAVGCLGSLQHTTLNSLCRSSE